MGDTVLKFYLTSVLLILFGMVTILTYLQLMDVQCRLKVHYTVNTIQLQTHFPVCCTISVFAHFCIIRKNTNMLSLVPNRVLTAYMFCETVN